MGSDSATKQTEALHRKALQGDAEAFWKLVKPHERTIFAVALGVLRDPERAEDVLHDTFLRAFSSLGNLKSETRLSSWLYGMARNVAHEHLRKAVRQEKTVAAMPARPEVVPVTAMLMEEERMKQLDACLDALPEQHRIVLGLKYMQNLSCKEIADTLGIGLEAAKSRLFEARKALHARMKAAEHQAATAPAPSARGVQTGASGNAGAQGRLGT
ncbi:MAG: sigma-70 family RNA polymerase sigma factor [Candidatus Sumerlaeia bacterium]|nr:sigma-70 family RNA polymerase sigma factor [Candidatus Sumerlaeia bacterium]